MEKERKATTGLEINLANMSKPPYTKSETMSQPVPYSITNKLTDDQPPYPNFDDPSNFNPDEPPYPKTDQPQYPTALEFEASDNTSIEPSLVGGWNITVLRGREIKHF